MKVVTVSTEQSSPDVCLAGHRAFRENGMRVSARERACWLAAALLVTARCACAAVPSASQAGGALLCCWPVQPCSSHAAYGFPASESRSTKHCPMPHPSAQPLRSLMAPTAARGRWAWISFLSVCAS